MINIYGVSCILTIDHDRRQNLVISKDKDNIILPIFKIDYPRLLFNEIKYNIQQILSNEYDKEIIKRINFSYTDIQNEFLIKYIEDTKNYTFDTNNDVFILTSMILEKPYELHGGCLWKQFDFIKSFNNMSAFNSLVDFIIEKTII